MRSFFLIVSLIFLFNFGYSQNDTIIYYKGNNRPTLCKEDAVRLIKIQKKNENKFKLSYSRKKYGRWIKLKYTKILSIENDSTIKILNQSSRKKNYKTFKPVGAYYYIKEYYKSGKLKIEGLSKSILYHHWEGQVKKYFTSGKLSSISKYRNNQELGNKNWLKNGKAYFDNIYNSVDVMPEFPGGDVSLSNYLVENIKYPENAFKKRLQYRVLVNFVVDEDGNVIGTHVVKPQHSAFDKEAERVVSSMPKWSVGRLNGKAVKVAYFVPINFRLQ